MPDHTHESDHSDTVPVPVSATVVVAGPSSSALLLRAALADCGMSVRQLAAAMGLNKSTVLAWTNGTQSVSLANIMRMPVSVRERIAARLDENAKRDAYRRNSMRPHRHATLATMSLGEYARVVYEAESDGVVDAHEHEHCARAARKVESVMRMAAQDHESSL